MLIISISSQLTRRINSNTRWQRIRSPRQQRHQDHTPTRITVDLQSAIDEVPSPREQRSATTRDLLLSINDRGDNSGINDARHSKELVGWANKTTVLDKVQWGMFPFQSKAYVPLGTIMLRFPPYWFGSMAIMTMIILVNTARRMTHLIRHQHAIVRLIVSFLRFIVLWSRYYYSYDSHDPHIFLSFSHTAQPESRPTFIWLFISLMPLFLLTQPVPPSCNHSIFTYSVSSSELFSVMATLVYIV